MKKDIKILSIISVVGLFILLSGCTSKSATSVFDKDPRYAQNLQYTQVGKIIVKDEVEALINVTYLNSVDSSKWDNEKQNFLVGTYITNKTSEDYNLTMNKQPIISTVTIKKSDEIYKNIAMRNNWADYSIVTFDDNESLNLNILYSHPKDGNASLTFEKE